MVSSRTFISQLCITILNKVYNNNSLKNLQLFNMYYRESCAEYTNLGWNSKLFQLIEFSFSFEKLPKEKPPIY